jgi:hypothetical protein
MLETTFCPNCGKPYDVSLGECPVCARRRAAEEAKRSAQGKARKGAKKIKKGKPQKPKSVLPAREVDEPTVPMDTEAIRRAEEEARAMAGQRTQQTDSADQAGPVQPEPAAPGEMEQGSEEEGVNKKLVIAVIGAALVLLLVIVGIGRALGGNTVSRHSQENPAASAPAEEEKEQPQEEPAEEEPEEKQKKEKEEEEEEPEEKPQQPSEEETPEKPEETPAEEPQEQPSEEEPQEQPEETPAEEPVEEQPAEPENQEPAEENQEDADTEETAAQELGAESASV